MDAEQDNNDITIFAKTNFRHKEVPFGIKREDRRRHMYIIGKTGMGKTTLMENMIIQDIANGNGLAFVDPHGDSVEKILDYVPSSRVNDVVYFNPADREFPIAFNILEAVDPNYKHLVASGLMGVFTKIWANLWSARMEYILNNAILALLDSPGNTLLGISRMLIDKKYRKRIVDNIKDPMVKSFWVDEFANWNEKYRMESIAPIQNKVGQFLSSGIIRNIVGQPKSTIDLRSLMDNKKIILMNLAKGRIGEDNSDLLGAMLITKLQLAALSRVDISEQERHDFFLYVDEFQNFATESFATILSEARKYRLNLTIGHQYIGQLTGSDGRSTKVRDAVFGNVGTIVTFRVGAADSEFLEKEFAPQFTENDLVNLPKHHIILKLMINGVASDPFTATTLAPETHRKIANTDKVIRISRERYANPVAEVEDKILRWMGQEYHEQAAVIASGARQEGEEEVETAVAPQAPAEMEKTVSSSAAQNMAAQQSNAAPDWETNTAGKKTNTEADKETKEPGREPKEAQKTKYENIEPHASRQYNSQYNPRPNNFQTHNARSPQPHNSYGKNNTGQTRNMHSNNHSGNHFANHPARPMAKKDNAIWETAAKMNRQKSQNLAAGLANTLAKSLSTGNSAQDRNNHGQQHKKILKPGESHKITSE